MEDFSLHVRSDWKQKEVAVSGSFWLDFPFVLITKYYKPSVTFVFLGTSVKDKEKGEADEMAALKITMLPSLP